MAFCSKCGKELRSGIRFCTGCGAEVSIDNGFTAQPNEAPENHDASSGATGAESRSGTANAGNSAGSPEPPQQENDNRPLAPTIVIAPPPKKDKKKLAKTVAKVALGSILLVIVIIAGVWATAWFMSNPFRSSPVEEVDNEKYTRMLALVEDVRNPNFDEVIDDLLTKKGKAENYSFLQEYTDKFNEILGDDYTEEEKLFCDCCYFVWYTEYMAKRYEWLSENSGLLNSLYTGKANTYRSYADTLYNMLCDADSVTDLNNIKIYCADHEIITDK